MPRIDFTAEEMEIVEEILQEELNDLSDNELAEMPELEHIMSNILEKIDKARDEQDN